MMEMAAAATFVHDFIALDLPFEVVVATVDTTSTTATLEHIVAESWQAEVSALHASRGRTRAHPEVSVTVTVGTPRRRPDAVIIPIRWRSASSEWVPPLDADLEIAAFGPSRTHVHVYGQSAAGHDPGAGGVSTLHHRLPVALVRHVLVLLAEHIAADAAAGSLVDPH